MEELDIDQRILQQLSAAQKILDVGCGNGHLVNLIASQTRQRVVGLDISSPGMDVIGLLPERFSRWCGELGFGEWKLSKPNLVLSW